jgi:hypothetical protein
VATTARRPTWWTRAQALNWIMTRRLAAMGEGKLVGRRDGGDATTLAAQARAERMKLEADPEWIRVFNNARDPQYEAYVKQRNNLLAIEDRAAEVTPWPERDPQATQSMLGVMDDALRRMQAAPAARRLPAFKDAYLLLEDAERTGLKADASGRFRRTDIQKHWPSPYGRGKGVAPKAWEKHIVQMLASKFTQGRRNVARDALRKWIEETIRNRNAMARKESRPIQANIAFRDPERWTAYVRRAIALAIRDIRWRRRYCSNDCDGAQHCVSNSDERWCLSRGEGAAMLANARSWLKDGPPPSGD